jgi:transcription elongation factor Elf1
MTDFKGIRFENDEYFEIGCRKCNSINQKWKVAVNLAFSSYILICQKCGHKIKLEPKNITDKPDSKAIDARFLYD